MSEPAQEDVTPGVDEGDISRRADLLPEEAAAGSDDPEAQAEAILAESEERIVEPEETREESVQTAPPHKRPGLAE